MKISLTHSLPELAAAAVESGPLAWLSSVLQNVKQSFANRALRQQLAEMDTAMLRDIGIDQDEIWRIRAGHTFTPRDWQ